MSGTKVAKPKMGDLMLRLMSAAVLIPFALYIVMSGGTALMLGCAFFAMIMAYEWVRMTVSPNMVVIVILAGLPVFVAWLYGLMPGLSCLIAGAILSGLAHPARQERAMQFFGYLYVAGLPFALFQLRDGAWDGAAAALIIMAIVWGSDSAAYFTGRALGGPRLHPDSPSKTWSGAIGAVVFSTACGVLAALLTGGSVAIWLVVGGLISVFAQLGDLFESSLKRLYEIKDSSALVPGHGGLLDRVDGLGFVCVVTVVIFMLMPPLVEALGLAT